MHVHTRTRSSTLKIVSNILGTTTTTTGAAAASLFSDYLAATCILILYGALKDLFKFSKCVVHVFCRFCISDLICVVISLFF